jgi:hypothetical protein
MPILAALLTACVACSGSGSNHDAGGTRPSAKHGRSDAGTSEQNNGSTTSQDGGTPSFDASLEIPDRDAMPPTADASTPQDAGPPPPPLVEVEGHVDTLALPSLDHAVDPRTSIQEPPDTTPVLPAPLLKSGRIAVLASSDQLRFPACKYPVLSPVVPTLTPVIDGDLGDWAQVTPVLVDRSGDGTADGDIVDFKMATDAAYYYFAVTFADGLASGVVKLDFYSEDPTQLEPGLIQPKLSMGLWRAIFAPQTTPTDMLIGAATASSPPASFQAVAAASGQGVAGVEFRLARADVDAAFGTGAWSIAPSLQETSGTLLDGIGAHLVGMQDDYACLVPLPSGRSKLFVFSRSADIDAEQAEVVYRAFIAAAPAVERAIGVLYEDVDTLAVSLLTGQFYSGLHEAQGVIYLNYTAPSADSGGLDPMNYFTTAAHEYVHGINDSPRVPAIPTWGREGHSQWAASKAVSVRLNAFLAQWRIQTQMAGFAAEEDDVGNASLADEPWPQAGHTVLYDYQKSEGFYHLLESVLPADALQQDVLQHGPELPMAFASDSKFTGKVSSNMWNGWFGGTYDQGILPRAMLFTDTDADGMSDVEESLAGLDPGKADTDGDGMTDLFELGAGRDPKKSDKDLGALIAADGRIDDWKRLVPDLLQSTGITRVSDAKCKGAPHIERYGVLFDGDWLLAAIELDQKPPKNYVIAMQVTTPEPKTFDTIGALQGQSFFAGPAGSVPFVVPFTQRATELHYHRSWLGWGKKVPRDFTVHVAGWFNNSNLSCEISKELQPSWAVP